MRASSSFIIIACSEGIVMSSKTMTMITSTRNLPLSNIWQASRVYYGGFQKWGLQSRQVKRTPQGSIKELIICKMNPFVVPVISAKLKSAFLHAQWAVNISRELLCIWSDWKFFNGLNFLRDVQIKFWEINLAGRNVLTAWRMNSRPHTQARMQRWIWNLQLPTDLTFWIINSLLES